MPSQQLFYESPIEQGVAVGKEHISTELPPGSLSQPQAQRDAEPSFAVLVEFARKNAISKQLRQNLAAG